MNFEKRIESSATKMVKAVFPNTTNHYDTLFGGTALQWMDETAFITATRFSRQQMVTVSSERIDFTEAIPAGKLVELEGRVTNVGNTSLTVTVTMVIEDMYSEERSEAIKGNFNMVALDENRNPTAIKI
ncbi:acyl-CoA thioesterase [Fodinibius halophilus]|uniref:Acyl-CoA thioesterase n=1 Tax=Fodinibius halophilus TaxID=1736908 RepID=A0A6M1SWH9_9BACT|nr:acyl-CoA thioesterase [Fodinibius halophilus]NGP88218.1 acyl-CoA thioesterase [Fodinibius halophilus]